MRRVRRVLQRAQAERTAAAAGTKPRLTVDLHSGNNLNGEANGRVSPVSPLRLEP